MIELYDRTGCKVGEIRDRRLVSMDGDCLGSMAWDGPERTSGVVYADIARREARYEFGRLVDERGTVLACCTDEEPRITLRWHELTLADWAYGRAEGREAVG